MQRPFPLFALAALLCFAGLVEGQVSPGTPSFGAYDTDPSGYTTINLQNLNVMLNVPLMSKSGAFPFRFAMTGPQSFIGKIGTSNLQPPENNAEPLLVTANGIVGGGLASGVAFYFSASTVTCPAGDGTGSATKYTGWYVQMVDGTQHAVPATDASYVGATCSGGFTDQTIDGSGHTLSVTGTTVNSLYDRSGASLAVSSFTDSSGNAISFSWPTWTDTLGLAVATGGTGPNYSWTDVNGGSPQVSVTSTLYTLHSAFGCTGLTDYNAGTYPALPITVTFPDTTTLGLAWEATPGFAADRTGRLATLTLRDGTSTVSFNYNPNSAAHDGVNCSTLIPAALARTTSDGTVSYTYSSGSGTTKVDAGGNMTIYQFCSGGFLRYVEYYQNTGTVASPVYPSETLLTTYHYNNSGGCLISEPIIQVDVYQTPGGMSTSSRQETKFDAFGNVTYSARYDFGASSPTSATTIVYGTSNGSGTCTAIGSNINNKPCTVVTTDGSGNTIASAQYAYDSHGNLTKTYVSKDGGSTFLSNSTANVYNSNGTASKTYDLANNETDYTYSSGSYSDGSPTSYPFPTKIKNVTTGLSTSYTYDATGGVKLSAVDASGNTTTYGYKSAGGTADPWWRVRSITDPLTNETWITPTATSMNGSFEFNSSSSISNVTTTMDGYGRPINAQKQQSPTATNYDTVTTTYNFGGVNPTVSKSIPCTATSGSSCGSGTGVTNTFDLLGRLATSVDGGGGTDTITYSQNDVLSVVGPAPSFDGQNTKQVQSEYDGLGRLKKSCLIGNGSSTACGQNTGSQNGVTTATSYTSGSGYKKTSSTRGSQTRSTTVDGMGRLTQKVTPEGGTWNYTYDTNSSCPSGYRGVSGQLASISDPNGNLICYAYDALNRVTGVNANGTTCRHFYYDSSTGYSGSIPTGVTTPTNPYGRMVEAATDACSSGTLFTDEWFSYDKDGHVTDQWESTPNSGTYYHSVATFTGPAVSAVQLKAPSVYTLNYGLDGEGRWNSLSKGSTSEVTIPASGSTNGYNPAGQPLTIGIGPGSDQDDYTYDSSTGRMTGWTFQVNSVQETGALNWNPIGTLKSLVIIDGFNSGGTQTCSFGVSGSPGYDDWNRLLYDSCGTGGSIWNQTYSYDQYDNLTKSSTGFVSWNPGYSSTTNHYTCTGCTSDLNGDVTNDGTNAYAWNEFSKMKSVNISGTNCASAGECLVYDALGRVVEIDSGLTHTEIWYTQLGKTAYMNGSTYVYAYAPAPGGGTWFNSAAGGNFYMHKDWLGNARIVSTVPSTGSGTVSTDRAYAPYGEVYDIFGSTATDKTMFGGSSTQDVISGMYDTPNRELQGAQQGRWLSPDPAGWGWNQYAYVTNPNSEIDPSGLNCDLQQAAAGGCKNTGFYNNGGGIGYVFCNTFCDSISSIQYVGYGTVGADGGPGSGSGSVTITLSYTDDYGNYWFSTDGGRTYDLGIYGIWGSGGTFFGAGNAYQGSGIDSSVSGQIGFIEGDGNQGYIDLNPGTGASASQTIDGPTPDQTVLANVSLTSGTNSVGTSIVQNPDGTISAQGTTFSEGYGINAFGPWQVQIPLSPSTPQPSFSYDPWNVPTSTGGFVDINPNNCYCLP